MAEKVELEANFLNDVFLDDILSSDFIDEIINTALNCDLDGRNFVPKKSIPFNNDARIKLDVDISKSGKSHKRKLSNVGMVSEAKQSKEQRSCNRLLSPNIDILKRAVARLKNDNKSIDSDELDNTSSGIGTSESTGNKTGGLATFTEIKLQQNIF